ncbi:OmpA family protein [Pedobacter sp. SD-b]|uniref:OmpA family protein n=1 Tax=Pedobacter segetis TaxID=2793069 RepID=A0ABS1BLH3_9SPHI|nr:OmpA family protein [Pedobacter segetis]MBK0383156.1 OmpA family protein [Pedobacter segetis]
MNYSTLKKTVALSLATAFAIAANAQDTMPTTSSAKTFGGRSQYRTWTLGLNGGGTVPVVITGGTNDFGRNVKFGEYTVGAYYGLSLRKQLGHVFGLQGNLYRGHVISYNKNSGTSLTGGSGIYSSTETKVQYDANLSGVFTLGSIDFLNRKNAVNFYATVGYGIIAYNPVVFSTYGVADATHPFVDGKGSYGDPGENHDYIKEAYIPVGVGVKFKLSDRVAIDLGYDAKFIDGDNFDGVYAGGTSKDKFSVAHAGLEFSLGSKSKPDLTWSNPIAMMYDELKDPTLRQEVEALKGRVTNVEQAVEDMKKDSDGDGVADYLDKCPNTPAGAKVDGAGCELDTDGDGVPDWKDKCPTEKGTAELNGCPAMETATMEGVSNIQFEYNSSVLRTSSYATLDKVSSSMRADNNMMLQLDGHASAEGTDAYNMQLSIDRANAVKTYLVNSGVDAKRIATKGYGETRPIASNATEEGRELNRRVEFRQK